MATGKRYYWIKLKESFMQSDVVDFLMSQPNGANYVVLYQMLCLKTINTGGRLTCHIGDIIIPFDIEKIQRDCKWFSLDTVRIALELYKQLGLIYEDRDGTLVLADHAELVGSETDWAAKKRRQALQGSKSLPPAGEIPRDVAGESCGENFPTDIRGQIKELRDKETRDKEDASTAVDPGLSQIVQFYEENIGGFPPAAREDLLKWREVFSDDLIIMAIKKAALSGVFKWNYIVGILRAWKSDQVRTLSDVKARDHKRNTTGNQPTKRSAADDYDEIFGGQ